MKKIISIIQSRLMPKSHRCAVIQQWKRQGAPIPPPHEVKQSIIIEYQQQFGYEILIETGTFLGKMIKAQQNNFKRIYSIELSEKLFQRAQKKFRKYEHITIYQGDSGKVLPEILKQIDKPAIFWLDGHYSAGITAKGEKECPIYEELESIFNSHQKQFNHVLLIDDARCFIGEGDYPTIEELTTFVLSKNENYKLEVKDDVIRYII